MANGGIQRVVGGVTAGEQGVAAGRGNFHGVEQRRLARYFGVDHVVMKHHLAVGQRADRLAVFADVRDQHDAGQHARIALGKIFRRPVQLAKLAEIPGHPNEIFLRQALAGKNDHEVIEPGLVNGADGLVIRLVAQIEPANFGPDVLRQRDDVEPRSGHRVHRVSSAALATLLSRVLVMSFAALPSSRPDIRAPTGPSETGSTDPCRWTRF